MKAMRWDEYVPRVQPLSRMDIEADAEAIHRRFCPELVRDPGPFDVLHFFEHTLPDDYGLDTGVEEMSDGVEGMTWHDGRVLVSEATYVGACERMGRPRFTIAHECYHGLRHRDQIKSVLVHTGELVLYRRHSLPAYRDPEWQANCFAAALLMPAAAVEKLGRGVETFRLVETIVDTFQVSRSAARIRADRVLGVKAS